jgi:tyrosinase
LDSRDLSTSPIWDPVHGFGGNGDINGPEIIHGGHCVLDGPFSNSTRAWSALSEGHSHDVTYWPHCLSRGFTARTASESETLHYLISPEFVRKTLDQPDYYSFFAEFEGGAHNAIPQFIKGDWLTFTAPNGQA